MHIILQMYHMYSNYSNVLKSDQALSIQAITQYNIPVLSYGKFEVCHKCKCLRQFGIIEKVD